MAEDRAVLKRQPPHDIEAEKSVICAMVMSDDAILTVSEMLQEGDYWDVRNRLVHRCIMDIYNGGEKVDLVILADKINRAGMAEVVGIDYMRDLFSAAVTSTNVEKYAKIVHEKSVMRRSLEICEKISAKIYEGKESCDDILAYAENSVTSLSQYNDMSDDIPTTKDIVIETLERIEAAASGKREDGLKTGLLREGQLIVLAARPGVGKTALALNLALSVAIEQSQTVAFFSLEMSSHELMERAISAYSVVDYSHISKGQLSDAEWEKIIDGAGAISTSQMIIDDTAFQSVLEIRNKCKKIRHRNGLGLVIIDYIGLIAPSETYRGNKQAEVSEISRSLKALSKELGCPVIALSQLNRACGARQDHRPMLTDLRDSGAVEQDADKVIFLHREDYYDKEDAPQGLAEIIIAKNRNGETGTVEVSWHGKYMKFANCEKRFAKKS
jgi:replicative DNA helicase